MPHATSGARAILASDTDASTERRQLEAWRTMSPIEKLELVTQSTQAVLELARVGIRLRHPEADDRECFLRLAVLKLGKEHASAAYPEIEQLQDL